MRRLRLVPYILLAPLFILEAFVIFLPSIINVGYAFTEWNGLSAPTFNGLANFQRLFADYVFWIALRHNVEWTIIFLTVPIAMALVGASLASRIKRGQMVFRVLYFIPYMIAPVVNAEIWRYILNPLNGIGPWLDDTLGWAWANVGFFSDRDLVLYTIANVDNWHWWGFLLVLYLAAMQTISSELFDAVRIDGGNAWHEFWHVILPGIRPTLVYTIVLTMAASFLVFDYVWILTEGGPAHGSEVLGSYMYKTAFYRFEVGYSSAIALGMTLLAASFSVVFLVLRKLGWDV